MKNVGILSIVVLFGIILLLGCTGLPSGNQTGNQSAGGAAAFCSYDESRSCVTSQNCPGTQTCASGQWDSCIDLPNDNCPLVGSNKTGLKEHTVIVWQENFTPDDYDIYLYDLETKEKRPVITAPANQFLGSVYQSKVAWQDYQEYFNPPATTGKSKIYMYDLKTGELSNLSNLSQNEQFSPMINDDFITWVEKTGRQMSYLVFTGDRPVQLVYNIKTKTTVKYQEFPIFASGLSGDLLLINEFGRWQNSQPVWGNWYVYTLNLTDGTKNLVRKLNYVFRPFEELGNYPRMDNKKVILFDEENNLWSIHIYDLETKEFDDVTDLTMQLLFSDVNSDWAVWQALGGYYFIDFNNQPYEIYNSYIYLYNTKTKEKRLLTPITKEHLFVYAAQPKVNGDKVVWTQRVNPKLNFSDLSWTQEIEQGNYQLFVYDISKNETSQLTNDTRDHISPLITRY